MTENVTIGRTELGLSDLVLSPPEYEATTLAPGARTVARRTATAHQIDGAVTVHRRYEQPTGRLRTLVKGADSTAAQSNYDTLLDALSQDEFDLTLDVDGELWTWECETADVDLGEVDYRWWRPRIAVVATFPRKPSRKA